MDNKIEKPMNKEHKELLNTIVDQRNKARHWKFCHYDASRKYKTLDKILGLSSVILSTIILGFAFYSVRTDVEKIIQLTLASLTVIQGVLLTVQLYLRPSFLAETHRNSAEKLGTLGRKWASLETKIKIENNSVDMNLIDELLQHQDTISRESEPIPNSIIRKYGTRNKN